MMQCCIYSSYFQIGFAINKLFYIYDMHTFSILKTNCPIFLYASTRAHNFPSRSSWQTFSYDSLEHESICPWTPQLSLMHPKVLLATPLSSADPSRPTAFPPGTHIQEGSPLVWFFQLFHSTDRLTFHYRSQAQPQCQDDFGNVQNTSLFQLHVATPATLLPV